MSKKEALPDPKSTDYRLKDSLIAQLTARGSDPIVVNTSLHDLGIALAANPLLSGRQQGKLISGLAESGLLTYQADYFAILDKAEEENRFEEVERTMKASLDPVHWDIERNGRLQAQTIVAAAQLSQEQPSLDQQVTITANLLNTAHLTTRRYSFFETPYDDERYQISFAQLKATEEAVFAQRVPYAAELVKQGLATPQEIEELGELDINAFRALRSYTELYDRLIALHFLRKSSATDTAERFRELQEVIYTGYAMGICDANAANARLYGEEEQQVSSHSSG